MSHLKLGVTATTISTGIPVIVADGSVEVSAEFRGPGSGGSPIVMEADFTITTGNRRWLLVVSAPSNKFLPTIF